MTCPRDVVVFQDISSSCVPKTMGCSIVVQGVVGEHPTMYAAHDGAYVSMHGPVIPGKQVVGDQIVGTLDMKSRPLCTQEGTVDDGHVIPPSSIGGWMMGIPQHSM